MAAIARLTLVSLVAVVCLGLTQTQGQVEVVQSSGGLPAEVAGQFRSPSAFQQGPDGSYYVFDRQTQTVYLVSGSGQTTPIVEIGPEQGRIIGANAFDVGPDGRFVVADAPDGRERVQIFGADGSRLGGFTLPGRAAPRITLGSVTLSGVGSLHFTGRSIVMGQPELGGLVTQFSLDGQPFHTFGVFRATGHEDNRDVHLALNSGFPLSTSQGDFYFVFQASLPIFRKFDARGQLRFERHIEGRELDGVIATLPNTWPKRADERGREFPVIPPTVRAAAVDQNDNLWVALTVPVVYVFDSDGEKIRTLRPQAAGPLHPDSLSFSNGNDLLVTPGCYRFGTRSCCRVQGRFVIIGCFVPPRGAALCPWLFGTAPGRLRQPVWATYHMPDEYDPFLASSLRRMQENITRAGPAATASYTLIGAILLLGGIGFVIDDWQDSSPWFLLTGLILGIIVGFYELAKTVWKR